MEHRPLLITGASGFLGWKLCHRLKNTYDLVGTYYRHQPNDLADVKWERINLLQTNAIAALVKRIQPQAILHLAAISNTTFCQEHPGMSYHVNVYATVALAEAAAQCGIPLLMASTDLVFNGTSAPYTEEDFTHPRSQYGQQKQAAEEILLSDFERTIVGRLPLLFGQAPDYVHNFFTRSVQALKKGESIRAFVDEHRSMVSTAVAAEWWAHVVAYALDDAIPWPRKERLFHLGGVESVTRYDFMVAVARQLGLNADWVEAGYQAQAPYPQTRPADVRLDSGLARKLFCYEPPALITQLQAGF